MKEWVNSIWEWLKGAFQTVIDTLKNLLQKIIDGIFAVANWLWVKVIYCGQVVWDFFFHEETGLLWTVCDWFAGWGEWFLEQFPDLAQVLDQYSSSADSAMTLVGKLNAFFPIRETVYLMGIFLGVVVLFLGVKLILKLIPTIGVVS